MVAHAHLYGCEDPDFLSGDKVQILGNDKHTEASSLIC